jgi:cytochrome c-type biogenesis protein
MLPIYFLYLAGESEKDENSLSANKSRLLVNSIGFVLGFTLVFVALGATVTSFGHFLANHRSLLEKVSGLVMIVFGLNFIGILKLNFLNMEKRIDYKFNRLRFLSSLVFGMVFGFGWTPCLGAFLGSALLLAGNSRTILQGILLLFLYSIGLGIPFILTAIVFDKAKGAFRQLQKHSRAISVASGILLIAAGIMVFTGSLKYLSYFA